LLKEGKVTVRMSSRDGNEVLIDELGSGDVFGWSAVLDDQMFKAAIWAVEDSTVIVLDGDKLKQLFDANNHIGYRAVRMIAAVTANRLEKLRARLVDQPFSRRYLVPAQTTGVVVTSEKSEMRSMGCPECSTANRPFAVINETEQYRCKQCGMVYYSPVGCETDSVTPSSDQGPVGTSALGSNWSASTPRGD
jgi:rubredoxin